MICGIDEAGRGPVIGPLVIVGACFENENIPILSRVKDSKQLTAKQREELFPEIIKAAKYKVIMIQPEEIDARYDNNTNLNKLEVDGFRSIIEHFKPERTFIDSPYKDCEKLKRELSLGKKDVVEHKADVNYPVVSAASIIAKVLRDAEIKKIEEKYKVKVGSGYPADPYTIEFLRKGKKYPFIRQSWETYKNIVKEKEQSKLMDF